MDKIIPTQKAIYILLGVIAFFILIGFLAFSASDGDQISKFILTGLGMVLVFAVFVLFPAWRSSALIPKKYLFGKPVTTLTIFFTVFWIALLTVVYIKPDWGWKYAEVMNKAVLPELYPEEMSNTRRRLERVNTSDGISKEEADLLFRDFMARRYKDQSHYIMAHSIEDKGNFWFAKSHVGHVPGYTTIDTLSIDKTTGNITFTTR